MALYGYHPPSITSSLRGKPKVQGMEDHIEHQQEALQLLKDDLNISQNKMKQQANQHHIERHFEVGEWAFPRLQVTTIQTNVPRATKEGQ